MKRSDFLKGLSALPLGIFAGNEIIKSIGGITDNEPLSVDDTITNDVLTNSTDGWNGSVSRSDLIDILIKRTNGKIGNTPLYRHKGTPTFLIKHQDNRILSIGDQSINRSLPFKSVKETPMVVKTKKTKRSITGETYSDREIVSCVYDDILYRVDHLKETRGDGYSMVVLYDIMLSPHIYHPDTFERTRSVLYRSGFIKLI